MGRLDISTEDSCFTHGLQKLDRIDLVHIDIQTLPDNIQKRRWLHTLRSFYIEFLPRLSRRKLRVMSEFRQNLSHQTVRHSARAERFLPNYSRPFGVPADTESIIDGIPGTSYAGTKSHITHGCTEPTHIHPKEDFYMTVQADPHAGWLVVLPSFVVCAPMIVIIAATFYVICQFSIRPVEDVLSTPKQNLYM